MKRIVRLTESDLNRIVKRVINENSFDKTFGDLVFVKEEPKDDGSVVTTFSKRMDGYLVTAIVIKIGEKYFGKVGVKVNGDSDGVVWTTNSNKNNVNGFVVMNGPNDVDFIREFVERAHEYGRSKYEYLNMEPLREMGGENMDYEFSYDIQSVDCGDRVMSGHVDIDEDDTIIIRYCEGNEDDLEYLKERGKKFLYAKYGRHI